MAINIEIASLPFAEESTVCHLMPCRVHSTGEANVGKYFTPYIQTLGENKEEFKGSFRGKPLNGKTVSVPQGYTGIVLKEPHQTSTEEQERKLKVTNKFDKFTYWNWDNPPSSNDKLTQALTWISVSQAIHAPISSTNGSQSQPSQ